MLKTAVKVKEQTWVGNAPSEWRLVGIKQVVRMISEEGAKELPYLGLESIIAHERRIAKFDSHMAHEVDSKGQFAKTGDVLFSKLRVYLAKGVLAERPYRCTSELVVLRVNNDALNAKYLLYVLTSKAFTTYLDSFSYGVKMPRISTKRIMREHVPLPSLNQQGQIVSYLDQKTEQLELSVENLKRQIELLEKYRRELIAHTVTRGLDDSAPMRDSGIDWIGQVPESWTEHSLKTMLRRVSLKNCADRRVLSVEREKGVVDRATEGSSNNHNRLPDDLSGYLAVDSGQFVMNKMKAWQGSYGVARQDGIVSPAYYVFELDAENREFFNWAIRSRAYVPFFGRDSYGIRTDQWDFKAAALRQIPFFMPPLEEQKEIAAFLEQKTTEIDTAIANIRKQIELLATYRKQLINDVVTGKIRVGELS